jgi:tetratricopeptide (TPR) repeat protein
MRHAWVWVWVGLLALTSCVSDLELGEKRYRAGDLHGALEIWRRSDDPEAATRAADVQSELERRVREHIASAQALEEQGRLAESILDYRLALALRPDDHETLDHVQRLARELVDTKETLLASYQKVRAQGDLDAAKAALEHLRALDPLEPRFETEERRLQAALAEQRRRRRARIHEEQAARVDALVEAGRSAFRDEQLETAIDLWRRALLIDPENERIQAYIGRAERQLEALERLRGEPEASGS